MITSSLIALLLQPMNERLKEFEKQPEKTYKFLPTTAFDQTQSLQIRWRAITTMGRLDPIHFQKDLEKALQSTDWYLRNAALIAILNVPRDVALKWSTQMLKDPALMVRTQAVRNLVGINATEAEPILWQQIWDKRNFRGQQSLWIRAHMAEALARLAPPTGRAKHFQKLILDPDSRLHKWAIQGLEKSTGMKMSAKGEPIDVQRQKWLSRLGVNAI